MTITVRTNNVPRDIVEAYELTADERAQFDYINWSAVDAGEASPTFFRYRGELYDIGEFQVWTSAPADHPAKDWDGYQSDTFFSATVIRYVDDFERVVVGRIYS